MILFDGVCNFCNFWIRWVIRRDTKHRFKFASLQSEAGQALLQKHGLDASQLGTVVLIDSGVPYLYSSAALRICRYLNGAWPLLYAFVFIPAALRDAVYRYIARHRYQWFGKTDQCILPTPDMANRFLSENFDLPSTQDISN